MLLRSRRRLCITCQIGSTRMCTLIVEANRTLSDEAGDELLLLYGRTDTALEIALVKHSEVGIVGS
jgi:hypothetical protein